MQLKRDTDYALRLLYSAAEYGGEKGIHLSELCSHAAVPRTIASRLCAKLEEAGLLKENRADGLPSYSACEDIRSKSLLDVVDAIEGTTDLFAVFDWSSEMYSRCSERFDAARRQFTECLRQISLGEWKSPDA